MSNERSALIEAVARAMVARQFNEWEQLDGGDQGYFMELAEAAIASVIAHATVKPCEKCGFVPEKAG